MLTRALIPILRMFVLLLVTFAVIDSTCNGERVNGDYLRRKLPLVMGLSVALGLVEARRPRRG